MTARKELQIELGKREENRKMIYVLIEKKPLKSNNTRNVTLQTILTGWQLNFFASENWQTDLGY